MIDRGVARKGDILFNDVVTSARDKGSSDRYPLTPYSHYLAYSRVYRHSLHIME
jgi:hypothetical protein